MKKLSKKTIIILSIIGSILLVGLLSYLLYFKNIFMFKNQEKLLLDGAVEYFEMYKSKLPKINNYTKVDLETLYSMSFVDTLYVPGKHKTCSENSYVKVINDDNRIRYVTYLECGKYKSNIDNTAPVIKLEGDTYQVVGLGSTFVDLGIKEVKDNKDKNIDKSSVRITSNVDTSKRGNYTVTYSVYDSNYNLGTITRNVLVADSLYDTVIKATGDGTYVGSVTNNYIYFSGMLFRIVKVNGDRSVKIVSNGSVTALDDVSDNVSEWLNDYY